MNNEAQSTQRTLPGVLLLFAALLLALLLPLRIWQQANLVEPGTGFWLGSGLTVILLYAGLALLAAVPAGAAFALRKRTALDLTRKRRLAEGAAAALLAAAMVWDAVAAFRGALALFMGTGDAFSEGIEAQSSSPAVYYIRSGAMACVLESVFGLVGAVFFGTLAAADCLPKKKIYLSRAMSLAPLVWAICRVLRRFSRTISYLRVSDLFLGLAMLVALMLFLLAFAQLVGNFNHAGKASVLFAAGIPAAVLALLCFVPRIVAYGLGNPAAPQDALIEWCDPAAALFIAAFLAGRLSLQKKEKA